MSSTAGPRPLVCEFGSCGRTYSTLHARRQHYRRQHSGDWQNKKVERRLSRSGRSKSTGSSAAGKITGRCTSLTRATSAQQDDTPPCEMIASPEFHSLDFRGADEVADNPAESDASQATLPSAPAPAQESATELMENINDLGVCRSASESMSMCGSAPMYSRHSSIETSASRADSQQYSYQPPTPPNSDSASITADAASLSVIDELLMLLQEENLLLPPPPAPAAAVQSLCSPIGNTAANINSNSLNISIGNIGHQMPFGVDMADPVAVECMPLLQFLPAGPLVPPPGPPPPLMFAPAPPSAQPPWLLYDNLSPDVRHYLSNILLV